MAKIPKELQIAILNQSTEEKDKLLLKLISKNDLLINQLHFQLLGSDTTQKEAKDFIKSRIDKVSRMYHESPGWMMMDMRELNGRITDYVKITKDKNGEIELTLYLLNTFFDNQYPLLEFSDKRTDTIEQYIIRRTEFVLSKLKKIHEDYHIEFEEEVNKMLHYIHRSCTSSLAKGKIPKTF